MARSKSVSFAIDRGGTFTDVYAEIHDGEVVRPVVMKLLSEDPDNYSDAPREGIRRVLEQHLGMVCRDGPIPTEHIERIRMGTTVATNALLERKGASCVFLVTEGFRDLLVIGNQARPDIFDLTVSRPGVLYEDVIEVEERVGFDETGKPVVLTPVNIPKLSDDLKALISTKPWIKSVAVTLLHSYIFPEHEMQIGTMIDSLGSFCHVSLSSQLTPMVKMVPRGYTSVVDAYLTPKILEYIASFRSGFKNDLRGVPVEFMQSDGGLCEVSAFTGYRAILSGPAGGVVGFSQTAYESMDSSVRCPVIGFDMGGTSTDVSRYGGRLEHVFETQTAGVTVQAPQLDIHTVAAGGGSRLFYRSGLFVVGPESAGAHPGPICYRKGGHLAITDANLFLGRINADQFPRIFGPNADQPLDWEASKSAFIALAKEVNDHRLGDAVLRGSSVPAEVTPEEVALGFIRVANETMCRPIRAITEARGFDVREHALACFGGAGGQHACGIARLLGITTVYVHRYSGLLSAYGIRLASAVSEKQEPVGVTLDNVTNVFQEALQRLETMAREELVGQGVSQSNIRVEHYLNLRYDGTDFGIMILRPSGGNFRGSFEAEYHREHGFSIPGRPVVVDDARVRAFEITTAARPSFDPDVDSLGEKRFVQSYFESTGWVDTEVRSLFRMQQGSICHGPLILVDKAAGATIVVEPGCSAQQDVSGNLVLKVSKLAGQTIDGGPQDTVLLSLFAHRFMGIAEQMGRTLQRTAISTNIKERLDFSCALFDDTGGLVANAPHVPVHLGSMQDAVRYQISLLGDSWENGQVILTNHPLAGGTHLPDITVITPVFHEGRPIFYLASRGHQCDIGGITPGSMPPFSHSLDEEGFSAESMTLVKDGHFQEEQLIESLAAAGCRCLQDVVSDLRAQVAANQKGVHLMNELVREYSLAQVLTQMRGIQHAAAIAVQDTLVRISLLRNLAEVDHLTASDFMDDGSIIQLNIKIDRKLGRAVFDFTGTGAEVYANTNAPTAIAKSAVIYCLRCLVPNDIPLNQGCMDPVELILPEGSLLCPSKGSAVVGGNVLTSQRITDVIFKAFGAASASQGCMNNLTFGDATFGYYETIAGGAGAGPTWDGTDGVHTHMTNTRITDPEILEKRYPVRLVSFKLRDGSGGDGKHRGGCGVIRQIQALRALKFSILSERRVFAPYGLEGGDSGSRGLNILVRADGRRLSLGGKNTVDLSSGDSLKILTPGGGGYGHKPEDPSLSTQRDIR